MICNARSVWLNGRLYVGGGYNRLGSDAQLLIYCPSDDTWEVIPTPTVGYSLTHSLLTAPN